MRVPVRVRPRDEVHVVGGLSGGRLGLLRGRGHHLGEFTRGFWKTHLLPFVRFKATMHYPFGLGL